MADSKNSTWHGVDDTPEYARAWEHHWRNNPHHWQYWLTPFSPDSESGLSIGDYVFGVADNAPFDGVVIETRTAQEYMRSEYKIQTKTQSFWAFNSEITDRCSPMDDISTREMIADWYGAGMAQGKPDIAGWYEANGWRMDLHPATRERVEDLLPELSR